MRDNPNGADLLDIAMQEFNKTILPKLPQELKYSGLMIANAMAIAERQFRAGNDPNDHESVALDALQSAQEVDMHTRYQRLCQTIRSGKFDQDSPHRRDLLALLSLSTQQRLAECNPRFMKRQKSATA